MGPRASRTGITRETTRLVTDLGGATRDLPLRGPRLTAMVTRPTRKVTSSGEADPADLQITPVLLVLLPPLRRNLKKAGTR